MEVLHEMNVLIEKARLAETAAAKAEAEAELAKEKTEELRLKLVEHGIDSWDAAAQRVQELQVEAAQALTDAATTLNEVAGV